MDVDAAPGRGTRDAVDPAVIESLREIGGDTIEGRRRLALLVDVFVDDSRRRLEELEHALREGDEAGVRRLSHSLAGSSATMGARPLADRCRTIEAGVVAGDLTLVASLLPVARAELAAAGTVLRTELVPAAEEGMP